MWCYFDPTTLEREKIQFTKIKIKTNIIIILTASISTSTSSTTSTSTSLTFQAGPAPHKDLVDGRDWTEIPRTLP